MKPKIESLSCTKVRAKSICLTIMATLCIQSYGMAQDSGKVYGDEELYAMAYHAARQGDDLTASILLYSYIQRNPTLMQHDAHHKANVRSAYEQTRANSQISSSKGDDPSGKSEIQGGKKIPQMDIPDKIYGNEVALRGTYTLQQKSNNRYLDAYVTENAHKAVTRTWQNNATQHWIILPRGNNAFTLQQKSSGRYLDAYDQCEDYSLATRKRNPGYTQLWILQKVEKNTYTLQQKSTYRYVDAHEGVNDNKVVTRTRQNNDTQRWIIKPVH